MGLNKRQNLILEYINKASSLSRLEIENYVASHNDKTSKATIIRDIDVLIKNGYIKKQGTARNTVYLPIKENEILMRYDINNYFKVTSKN